MEESVLLGTKQLVDSIRHFIRDPSGVFFVCHLCECRIVQLFRPVNINNKRYREWSIQIMKIAQIIYNNLLLF